MDIEELQVMVITCSVCSRQWRYFRSALVRPDTINELLELYTNHWFAAHLTLALRHMILVGAFDPPGLPSALLTASNPDAN